MNSYEARQHVIRGYYRLCMEQTLSQKRAESKGLFGGIVDAGAKIGDKAIEYGGAALFVAPIAAGALVGLLASKATSPDADAEVAQRQVVSRAISNQVAAMQRRRAFRLLAKAREESNAQSGVDENGRKVGTLHI